MIGSIPSYVDHANALADDSLYPQLPHNMYNGGPYQSQPSAAQFIPQAVQPQPQPQQQHSYDSYDSSQSMYPQHAQPQAQAQSVSDLAQASFADLSMYYGVHPDQPIQISAPQLPQSPTAVVPGFNAPPFATTGPIFGTQAGQTWQGQQQHWQNEEDGAGGMGFGARDDSGDEGISMEMMDRMRPRLPGACVNCKTLKVKCEFMPGHNVCNRCRSGKKECRVLGRKPRRPPPKREELLNKIKEQENMIKDLQLRLEKAHITTPSTDLNADSPESGVASSPPNAPQQVYANNVSVANQDIQKWIAEAKVSANTGDLRPADVTPGDPIDDHEGSDPYEDDGSEEEEDYLSPPREVHGDGAVAATVKSPAVGTTLSPIGMIAASALKQQRPSRSRKGSQGSVGVSGEENQEAEVGVANARYFGPGVSTNPELRWAVRESQPPPKIFSQGLVSPREVDKLFEIYFERMNLSVSLLDPKIYTAQTTYWRSPFLFTVICAIAARYLTERPTLYRTLMGFAKFEAGQALVAGLKSPELVAGYILLSLYPVPSTRWEEDRGWLMLGVAIRMATDLNLHHSLSVKANTPQQQLEKANRIRIWINCYNLDRSTSTQFGKPSTIKEDYVARHSNFWYRQTGFNYDIQLCGYTALLRVMGQFHEAIYSDPDQPTGLNMKVDFEKVTERYECELMDHWKEWEPRFEQESDKSLHCLYRIELLRLANAYSRLVIMSFRFQHALQKGLQRGDPFLQRCIDTASSVVKIVVDRMAPHPFLRTAPDAQFVFASFASVFLLKLLRPRFSSVLDVYQRREIISLIQRLIDVLNSENVAIDDRHTPKLYSRFLRNLLQRHTRSSGSSSSTRGSEQPLSPPASSEPSTTSFEYHAAAHQPQYHQDERQKQHQQMMPVFQVTQAQDATAGIDPAALAAESYPIYQQYTSTTTAEPGLMPAQNNVIDTSGSDTMSATTEYAGNSRPRRNAVARVAGVTGVGMTAGGNAIGTVGGTDTMRSSPSSDDAMLAPMRAITNPTFWDDMMMPGFTWTPMENTPEFYQQYAAPTTAS